MKDKGNIYKKDLIDRYLHVRMEHASKQDMCTFYKKIYAGFSVQLGDFLGLFSFIASSACVESKVF